MKTLHKTLLAAGLLAGIGLTAVAQTPAPAAAAPQAQAQAQPHRGEYRNMEQRRARTQEMRQVRMERRLAALKLKLQVSGAQESAWTAWTSAMKPVQRQRPDRAAFVTMTTPERIDAMRALRSARSAEMDRRGEATKAFYATLNADQKKVFDGESLRFDKRGNRGKGGHGHHHRG
ncbi:MAG: Spy/CpxP family protein refolding chaperone [Ramlibacter sp.]